MFNKLQFNNLVISNSKKIQQARVQTVQKLVQKIRKYKLLQEKKLEDEKIKERIRRSSGCMEALKKMKRLEVMRSILLLDKSPTAILTNGRAMPEETVLAMLALNKIIQGLVKQFREALKLDSAGSSWREEIMQTSKRRNKINRTEEKRLKRKEIKENKAVERKRVVWLQENVQEQGQLQVENECRNNERDDMTNVANAVADIGGGVWKIEKLEEAEPKNTKAELPKNSKMQHKEQSAQKTNPKKSISKLEETELNDSKKELPVNGQTKHKNQRVRKSKINKRNLQKKTETPEQESSPNQNYVDNTSVTGEVPTTENPDVDVKHVVDPFFITATGENYLSTAVRLTNETAEEPTSTQEVTRKRLSMHALEPRDRTLKKKSFEDGRVAHMKRSHSQPAVANEKLHPSWAAKLKTKPIVSKFQGKRITFDDGVDYAVGKVQTEAVPKIPIGATNSKGAQESNLKNLHPSWLAKQKQKPTITTFQGKKITFNADDD